MTADCPVTDSHYIKEIRWAEPSTCAPPDTKREARILYRKLLTRTDFILTQPVCEPEIAVRFLKRSSEEFGPLETPLLVGVLPLYVSRHASFLHNEVPDISIPDSIHRQLMGTWEHSP